MNRCLILVVAISSAACSAAAVAAQGSVASQQPAPDSKTVAAQVGKQVKQPAPVRHLSEQERAELRRQLVLFNQQNTRRP